MFLGLCMVGLYAAAALHPVAPFSGDKSAGAALEAVPGGGDSVRLVALAAGPFLTAPASEGAQRTEPASLSAVESADKLSQLFVGMGYTLEGVRHDENQVPQVFMASLPSDLKGIDSIETRKAVFLKTLLPLVLKENERILLERGRVLALRQRHAGGRGLTPREREWLEDLALRYGLESLDFDRLLTRVDIIPPSLALAQAAEESGWGTSRFAVEGNAPFGQWTFDAKEGLVPSERDKGKSHLVRAYDDLLDGVRAYARNLNTHRAYREFRKMRAETRGKGRELDGYALAGTLKRYSERGAGYVESVRTIMRTNELRSLDRARLKGAVLAKLAVVGG